MKKLLLALLLIVGFALPAAATESTDGTTLPVASSITDFFGNTWTLTSDSSRKVQFNGSDTNLTNIQEVWYLDHQVYAFSGGQWWQFVNSWSPATAVAITTTPPLPTTPGLRAAVGPQTGVSCTGVNISAGANIQTSVDANPTNTTFCLATGTYSGQTVTPKDGDIFIGAFDGTNYAVMDGGALLPPVQNVPTTSTSGGTLAAGTYYYRVTALNGTGETTGSNEQSITTTGTTSSNTITWSASTGATGYRVYRGTAAGSESVYYAPGNVTTFTDTGAAGSAGTVPASNTAGGTSYAFTGAANYVTIRNIKMTAYANPTQAGTVDMTGTYLVLQNNLIQLSAQGAGFRSMGGHALILSNHLYQNAEEGYSIQHVGNTMDNNDIDNNNPTNSGWDGSEQGGGKAVNNSYLTVWYNYAHLNGGPGFWTDADNIYVLYWYNKTLANTAGGIEHEISYNMSVRGNHLEGDGTDPNCPSFFTACGEVQIENSGGIAAGSQYAGMIEVYDNTMKPGTYGRSISGREQNRGNGAVYTTDPYWVRNLWIHNNVVDMTGSTVSGQVGISEDDGDNALFTFRNNKWDYNTYKVNDSTPFLWQTPQGDNSGTWAMWQAAGQDLHGSIMP